MNGGLILASSSPRRSELLKSCKIDFVKVDPDFDEESVKIKNPFRLADFLSYGKAYSVASRDEYKNFYVMGVDTVVYCKGEILGKPKDRVDAERMIRLLSGRRHSVITSVSMLNIRENLKLTENVESFVYFNRIDRDFISYYLNNKEWDGYAGGYAIQGIFALVVKKIVGSYSNIVGLPMEVVYKLFKKSGIKVLT